MVGQSFKTIKRLADYAAKHKIKIAFNTSPYVAEKGASYLSSILKRTEILVLNKEEASILVGNGNFKKMLKKLHKLGPKIVSITDGNNDSHTLYNNMMYIGKPTYVNIVETTGAGDAFASSFLSGMIRKNDVEFALKLATTNAESVIQYHGAKEKLLTYNEALRVMKKRPVKVIKKKI